MNFYSIVTSFLELIHVGFLFVDEFLNYILVVVLTANNTGYI